MMTDLPRKSFELFRVTPNSDLVAKLTPANPTPDQIVPGEVTIVRDDVEKWACFHCPGGCSEIIKLSHSKDSGPQSR